MPRVVKKRRSIVAADEDAKEEHYDLVFPDEEEEGAKSFKLIAMAHAQRRQQQAQAAQVE